MPSLVIRVFADTANMVKGFQQAGRAAETFSSEVTVSSKRLVDAQISASVKTQARLKEQIALYAQVAAAAQRGSAEQVAAARLGAEAQNKLQRELGQTAVAYAKAGTTAREEEAFLAKATRGALAGTGAFKGLAGALVFAGGTFAVFEGATEFLTHSIEIATDAVVSQRSLAAQMKANGEVFAANSDAIEKASLNLAKFGLTSEDAEHALTILDRGTGSVQKSIGLLQGTADVAAAKGLKLGDAAAVVAKVFGGQETALRRAVPGLPKYAHGLDLIQLAFSRVAGQAAANTTPLKQFHAALFNTERIVGTALLPTFNKYLTSLTNWLQRMNESGKLEKDVNNIVRTTTGLVNAAVGAWKEFSGVLGGTVNTVKLLVGAWAGLKIGRIVAGLGGLTTAIKTVGTEAKTSTGEAVALRGALTRLGTIGLITIGIELVFNRGAVDKAVSDFLDKHGLPGGRNTLNPQQVIDQYQKIAATFGKIAADEMVRRAEAQLAKGGGEQGFLNRFAATAGGAASKFGATVGAALPPARLQLPGTIAGTSASPLTPDQLRKLGLAADPNNLKLLREQVEHDKAAIAFAKKLLASGRFTGKEFVAAVTGYEQDKRQTLATIQQLLQKGPGGRGITVEQRNTWFDNAISRMLDRVQDIPTLKGQIARLKQIRDLVLQRANGTKDVTRRMNLEDRAQEILRTALGDQAQRSQNIKAAADAAKQKREAANQAILDWLQVGIDKAGLTKGLDDDIAGWEKYKAGIEREIAVLGDTAQREHDLIDAEKTIADLKQQQTDARKQAVADAFQNKLDWAQLAVDRAALTDNLTGELAGYKKQLAIVQNQIQAHGKTLDLEQQKVGILGKIKDTRDQQAQQAKDAADAGKNAADQALADTNTTAETTRKLFKRLNATAFLNQFGQNLTRAQKLRIQTGLAMTGIVAGGGYGIAPGHSHQFTGGLTINGGVHMHGVQDVPAMENQLAKRAKQRPHVRRGARG